MHKWLGITALVGYVLTIWLANWAIQRFGPVSVGFGLMAPAGVYFAGLAFTLRDLVQDALGRRAVVIAVLIGAMASYLISPAFATASAVAFLASEMIDFSIYTPLRQRHWLGAVLLSNTAGLAVDSALFLWLAFHSLAFFWGQVVGKGIMTIAAIAVLGLTRIGVTQWRANRCPEGGWHDVVEITLGDERCRKCGATFEYNAYIRYG